MSFCVYNDLHLIAKQLLGRRWLLSEVCLPSEPSFVDWLECININFYIRWNQPMNNRYKEQRLSWQGLVFIIVCMFLWLLRVKTNRQIVVCDLHTYSRVITCVNSTNLYDLRIIFFLSCIKQISNKGVSPSGLCQFSFERRSTKGFSLYSTHPVSFFLLRWSECSTFCHVLFSFNLKAIYLFISESLPRLGGWLWSICQVDCFEWVSIPKSLRCLSNQPADYKWSSWLLTNLQWRPKPQNLRMYEAVRNFVYGRSWKCSSECYFSSKRGNSKAVECKGRV